MPMFPFAFSTLFCYSGWSQIVQVIYAAHLLFSARITYRSLAVLDQLHDACQRQLDFLVVVLLCMH